MSASSDRAPASVKIPGAGLPGLIVPPVAVTDADRSHASQRRAESTVTALRALIAVDQKRPRR